MCESFDFHCYALCRHIIGFRISEKVEGQIQMTITLLILIEKNTKFMFKFKLGMFTF